MDKILKWEEETECQTCGSPLYVGDAVHYFDGDPFCCIRCTDVAQHHTIISAAYREYMQNPEIKIAQVIATAKAFHYTSEGEAQC